MSWEYVYILSIVSKQRLYNTLNSFKPINLSQYMEIEWWKKNNWKCVEKSSNATADLSLIAHKDRKIIAGKNNRSLEKHDLNRLIPITHNIWWEEKNKKFMTKFMKSMAGKISIGLLCKCLCKIFKNSHYHQLNLLDIIIIAPCFCV